MLGQADVGVRGPSDREVVAHLQRLASARAHLLPAAAAVEAAAQQRRQDQIRIAEIEDAHTTVLWAQATLLTATRTGKAERALEQAVKAERQTLRRHGHTSFASYVEQRSAASTTDIALELAGREFAAAQAEWEALCAEPPEPGLPAPPTVARGPVAPEARVVRDEARSTVVIDLTGDNPRRIA